MQNDPGEFSTLVKKLHNPVPQSGVTWKVTTSGVKGDGGVYCQIAPIIDSRCVQEMFDSVLGPENWKDEYSIVGSSMLCTIYVKVPNDDGSYEWVGKTDGVDVEAPDRDNQDATKGMVSNSFKRAAVKWGVGRHLYNAGKVWAETSMERVAGWMKDSAKDKRSNRRVDYWWREPAGAYQKIGYGSGPERYTKSESSRTESRPSPQQSSKASSPPSQPKSGRTPIEEIRDLLTKSGCSTKEDASHVVRFVTSGEVSSVDDYMSSGEKAKAVACALKSEKDLDSLLFRSREASKLEAGNA